MGRIIELLRSDYNPRPPAGVWVLMVLAVVATSLLVYDDQPGHRQTLEVGRRYHTLGIECAADRLDLYAILYAVPLTSQWPDAGVVRTNGYSWLVGVMRRHVVGSDDFGFSQTESDWDYHPAMLKIEWELRVPFSVIALCAGVWPGVWAVTVIRRMLKRGSARSFPIGPGASK